MAQLRYAHSGSVHGHVPTRGLDIALIVLLAIALAVALWGHRPPPAQHASASIAASIGLAA